MKKLKERKLKAVKQLTFQRTSGWGGKRKGAGRKNLSGTVNHMTRLKVNIKTPLNITLKLKEKLPNLRNKSLLKEFNDCVKKARHQGLYVIHFSLLNNHIHLIVEAYNNEALASGMQSLAGRFAKIIRRHAHEKLKDSKKGSEKGSVFKGRYHLHALKTPTEMKNALEYVLLNDSKHRNFIEHLDPFSSANHFTGWKKLLGKRFSNVIQFEVEFRQNQQRERLTEEQKVEDEAILSSPRSWLCRTGWEKACA